MMYALQTDEGALKGKLTDSNAELPQAQVSHVLRNRALLVTENNSFFWRRFIDDIIKLDLCGSDMYKSGRVSFAARKDVIMLLCPVNGVLRCTLTGIGVSEIQPGHISMMYLPENVKHHIDLTAGSSEYIQAVIDRRWLASVAFGNDPLEYFLQHTIENREKGIQQMAVKTTPFISELFERLLQGASVGGSYLMMKQLFDEYIIALLHLQEQCYADDNDRKKFEEFMNQLEKASPRLIDIKTAGEWAGCSVTTLRKILRLYVGQTPLEFMNEEAGRRLTYELAGSRDTIGKIVEKADRTFGWLQSFTKRRHQCTPEYIKRNGEAGLYWWD